MFMAKRGSEDEIVAGYGCSLELVAPIALRGYER